jgi:hypothetical protein
MIDHIQISYGIGVIGSPTSIYENNVANTNVICQG